MSFALILLAMNLRRGVTKLKIMKQHQSKAVAQEASFFRLCFFFKETSMTDGSKKKNLRNQIPHFSVDRWAETNLRNEIPNFCGGTSKAKAVSRFWNLIS